MPLLRSIGGWITSQGIQLHTGNADGSDEQFAYGGNINPDLVHLHLPCKDYNFSKINTANKTYFQYSPEIVGLAAAAHPAWNNIGSTAKKFLTRNASIVLSSDAVIAYQSYSKPWGGGTGHGLKIAANLGKQILLLSEQTDISDVAAFVEGLNA